MCEWNRTDPVIIHMPCGPWIKTIHVDKCLAPLIQMLNDYGITTKASCCGHGKILGSVIIDATNCHAGPHPGDFTLTFIKRDVGEEERR